MVVTLWYYFYLGQAVPVSIGLPSVMIEVRSWPDTIEVRALPETVDVRQLEEVAA